MKLKNRQSFTLIETIVVISVIGFTLPALFAIIFTILHQQANIYSIQEAKTQGDTALVKIENSIKNNGVAIYNAAKDTAFCENAPFPSTASQTSDNHFNFKNRSDNYFQYYLSDGRIIYETTSTEPITDSKVTVSDFELACKKKTATSNIVISISFKIRCQSGPILNYQTKIKLRNS